MKKFIKLFNEVNGKQMIKQYIYANVLLFAIFMTLLNGFSKKSLEIVRLSVNNKILKKLRRKYKKFVNESKERIVAQNLKHKPGDTIWIYWGQGIENAPELVKSCYSSVKENIKDRKIILLDDNNYKEYVSFPAHIQAKVDKGIISKTHFSDLLRLELLIKYGGTWMDSTVFCSGDNYDKFMLDSDLFFFQCLKPGLDGHTTCMSSWFLTATTNNNVLLLTKELLYKYWTNHNKMVDYFLIHDFMQISLETFKEEWEKVIPVDNATEHILLLNLNKEYNDECWNYIKNQRAFHKLSYKTKIDKSVKGSYYNILIDR